MIAVDEAEIVEVLQQQVAGVVLQRQPRVAAQFFQQALEGHAVVEILPRMQLEAQVGARSIERVENRPPAAGQFGEAGIDQPRRHRRIGIQIRPQQRAAESGMAGQP